MQPIIGLLVTTDDEGTVSAMRPYADAIAQSGGLPVILPYTEDDAAIAHYVALCDGFCFTGGVDIAPARYGEETSPACGVIQLLRDALELAVFRAAWQANKPLLGICRGAQVFNVALGGTLWQDLPSERPSPIAHRQVEEKFSPSHDVCVLPDTPLHALTGTARITANSFHHQAVKALGKDLVPMAYADDGVIEGFYHSTHPYLRAYQWHPERLCDTNAHNRLVFDDFIRHCCK